MVTLLNILTMVALPVVVVILTSLPGFIVLRLYPILLDFHIKDQETSETDRYIFFLMIFLGTLIAILLSDFLFGSFIATIFGLSAEILLIILAVIFIHYKNTTIIYGVVIGLGLSIGLLQTMITAFYGDQYNIELCYKEVNHYNFYLLGYFTAYLLSILITPLVYTIGFYGVCRPLSPNCSKFPLIIAIICLAVTLLIIIFMYRTMDIKRPDSKETTTYRMVHAFYIFIPIIFFWTFILLIQEFWKQQAKNMSTRLQDEYLEIIRAVIPIVCIPIGWLISIRNELLRITLGGLLIIISVLVSGMFGSFYAAMVRNQFANDNLTEVHFCSLFMVSVLSAHSFYSTSRVMFNVPAHMCVGPFLFDEQMFLETTNFTIVPWDRKSNEIYNLTVISPQNGFSIVVQRPTADYNTAPMKDIIAAPDRNFRSIAKLALIRLFSLSESTNKQFQANCMISINGIKPYTDIKIMIASSYFYIMELPEGLYNVSILSIAPTAVGHFNSSRKLYFRNGGYYILFASAPNVLTTYALDQVEISITTRIPAYVYSVHYQLIQYILLSLGKILMLSSGLEICYALGEKDMKCSLIGIFWGIYSFANFFFYFFFDIFMFNFMDSIATIYTTMLVAIVTFYCIYYYNAYKLTDVILQVDI